MSDLARKWSPQRPKFVEKARSQRLKQCGSWWPLVNGCGFLVT